MKVMTAELGKTQPILCFFAPPHTGAASVAHQSGHEVVSFDVGGTSADVAIIIISTVLAQWRMKLTSTYTTVSVLLRRWWPNRVDDFTT